MNSTFFDLETTGLDPLQADIITGYFKTVDENRKQIDELSVKLRPEHWSEEAVAVHGISKKEAMDFPYKNEGLRAMFFYLLKYPGDYICHANWSNFNKESKSHAYHYFDWSFLKHQCTRVGKMHWFTRTFEQGGYNVISTHTLAKDLKVSKKYDLKTLADKFEFEFTHHDSKSDALACEFIYYQLKDMEMFNGSEQTVESI